MENGEKWIQPEMLDPENNAVIEPVEEPNSAQNDGRTQLFAQTEPDYENFGVEWKQKRAEAAKPIPKETGVISPENSPTMAKPEGLSDIFTVMPDELIENFDYYYQQYWRDFASKEGVRFVAVMDLVIKNKDLFERLKDNPSFKRYLEDREN
jgi:hypothetical protein